MNYEFIYTVRCKTCKKEFTVGADSREEALIISDKKHECDSDEKEAK